MIKPTFPRLSAGEREMTDKPLPWPTHGRATEARNRSAECAQVVIYALRPLVEGEYELSETEQLRRIAKALDAAQEILRMMAGQGAPVEL